jgi:hypothetical protein
MAQAYRIKRDVLLRYDICDTFPERQEEYRIVQELPGTPAHSTHNVWFKKVTPARVAEEFDERHRGICANWFSEFRSKDTIIYTAKAVNSPNTRVKIVFLYNLFDSPELQTSELSGTRCSCTFPGLTRMRRYRLVESYK